MKISTELYIDELSALRQVVLHIIFYFTLLNNDLNLKKNHILLFLLVFKLVLLCVLEFRMSSFIFVSLWRR